MKGTSEIAGARLVAYRKHFYEQAGFHVVAKPWHEKGFDLWVYTGLTLACVEELKNYCHPSKAKNKKSFVAADAHKHDLKEIDKVRRDFGDDHVPINMVVSFKEILSERQLADLKAKNVKIIDLRMQVTKETLQQHGIPEPYIEDGV